MQKKIGNFQRKWLIFISRLMLRLHVGAAGMVFLAFYLNPYIIVVAASPFAFHICNSREWTDMGFYRIKGLPHIAVVMLFLGEWQESRNLRKP